MLIPGVLHLDIGVIVHLQELEVLEVVPIQEVQARIEVVLLHAELWV